MMKADHHIKWRPKEYKSNDGRDNKPSSSFPFIVSITVIFFILSPTTMVPDVSEKEDEGLLSLPPSNIYFSGLHFVQWSILIIKLDPFQSWAKLIWKQVSDHIIVVEVYASFVLWLKLESSKKVALCRARLQPLPPSRHPPPLSWTAASLFEATV